MSREYEKKMTLELTERELICLAHNSLYEVGAQIDRVRGAMDQIEADQENTHEIAVAINLIHDEVGHELKKLSNYLSSINLIGSEKRKAKK
ncbi:hypothetical protein [uncultured Dubosiella sp.]|uniref:hypothetical protein n=1 Tax=uncultured Dubosiella sp. TaxID=1937011 RepID=UPI002610D199|nr:hypothetical protein [uncultured Dubosiella sp.]